MSSTDSCGEALRPCPEFLEIPFECSRDARMSLVVGPDGQEDRGSSGEKCRGSWIQSLGTSVGREAACGRSISILPFRRIHAEQLRAIPQLLFPAAQDPHGFPSSTTFTCLSILDGRRKRCLKRHAVRRSSGRKRKRSQATQCQLHKWTQSAVASDIFSTAAFIDILSLL
jgi:hypothetical protein